MSDPNDNPAPKQEPLPPPPPPENASAAVPNPFDPASLRLKHGPGANLGLKKALLTVPIRKPDRSWFVRTHPDPQYRLETAVIDLKEENEIYLVNRELWLDLATEKLFNPRALIASMSRQGVLFLWPIRILGEEEAGPLDPWSRSAMEAADLARNSWIRVTSNKDLGAYEVVEACGVIPEPEWPDRPFGEILKIAFKSHYIQTPDHPILRRLRGE